MAEDSSGNWINPDSAGNKENFGNAVGAGVGIAGLGLEAYGAYQGYQGAKAVNSAQVGIIQTQQQMDVLRERMMGVQYGRDSLQVLRQAQQARSLALTNASGKGAQFGSGLQGGYGQIAGASAWQELGLSQKYQAGQEMFGLQRQESQGKIDVANAQLKQQEGSAWGNFGKDLTQVAGIAAKIAPMLLL